MAPRNPNVRQLPSGRWQARIRVDGDRVTLGTYPSKSEAARAVKDAEAALHFNQFVVPSDVTLGEYAEDWFMHRADLSPTTRRTYAGLFKLYIYPALGDRPLTDIDRAAVRRWLAGLPDNSQRPKAYRLLRAVMRSAEADRSYGVVNPCTIRGAGTEDTAERPIASVDQVFALADAVRPRWRMLPLLGAFTSARLGELMGLQRADVSPMHGRVDITKQRLGVGRGVNWKGPKSAAGVRQVSMPASVASQLDAHLEQWVAPEPDALLFLGELGGPLQRVVWHREWTTAREKVAASSLGLPDGFVFHDLRHTGNMLAAAVPGTSTIDLMRRLGHGSPGVALRYQHATDERDRLIADGLDSVLRARRA